MHNVNVKQYEGTVWRYCNFTIYHSSSRIGLELFYFNFFFKNDNTSDYSYRSDSSVAWSVLMVGRVSKVLHAQLVCCLSQILFGFAVSEEVETILSQKSGRSSNVGGVEVMGPLTSYELAMFTDLVVQISMIRCPKVSRPGMQSLKRFMFSSFSKGKQHNCHNQIRDYMHLVNFMLCKFTFQHPKGLYHTHFSIPTTEVWLSAWTMLRIDFQNSFGAGIGLRVRMNRSVLKTFPIPSFLIFMIFTLVQFLLI